MIVPTVGRIVLYKKCEGLPLLAAIITCVHNDRCVNLTVFGQDGQTFGETSVMLVQPEDENPGGVNWCQWMPYQVKKLTGSESGEKDAGQQQI